MSTNKQVMVNMHAAKTQLSRLVEQAAQGVEVLIARNGVPVVRLVPVVAEGRVPGVWKGLATDDAFFAPLPDDVLRGFGG